MWGCNDVDPAPLSSFNAKNTHFERKTKDGVNITVRMFCL